MKNYIRLEHYRSVKKILPVIRAGFSGLDAGDQREALEDVDWSYVAEFSRRQRILPILYYNLKKSGLDSVLPASTRTFLQTTYTRIAGNNLRLARRLTDLCGLFGENGIQVVPYKGPVLAQALYGDSALRYCQDLDLLVPRGQLKEVWHLLHDAGYRPAELPFITQKRFLVFAEHGNEFDFVDAGGIAVDLHWKIAKHTRYAFDVAFCAPRLKQIELNNRTVWRLSDEDMILAQCLNGGSDLWPHLESVLVLADIIAASPTLDWDLLGSLARQLRCARVLLLGLFLSADIFDSALPGEIRRQLTRDRMLPDLVHRVYQGMFQNQQASDFSNMLWQMRIKEHPADKVRYALRRFFIPTKKDWATWSTGNQSEHLFTFLRPIGYIRETWRRKTVYEKK